MLVKVIDLKCSNCGDSLSEKQSKCESCGSPVVIKKMSSLMGMAPMELNKRGRMIDQELQSGQGGELASDANFTSGCCFLKLKLYDQALSRFERAFNADMGNAESYFYAAVALLKGCSPFATSMTNIKKAEEYVNAAIMIDDRPLFHYLLAYIKNDFYARKFLRVNPDWKSEFSVALQNGLGQDDQEELFALLGQPCPRDIEV